MKGIRIILISGLSGSGKTTAIKALEDIGFFCVDNLPILLMPKFIELCEQSGGKISNIAMVEDIRGVFSYSGAKGEKSFFEDSRKIIEGLRKDGYSIEIIFLETSDNVLVRRFSQTRREHPLAMGRLIREAIQLERELLQGIRDMANQIIDTTDLNVHQLKKIIQRYAREGKKRGQITVTLLSFGYSFGIPFEADIMMDVRFLPNPYFVEDLKGLRGDNPKVIEYVLKNKEAQEFLNKAYEFILFLLPLFEREGKTHLTIAIGCTGGQHRSMVIVNKLAEMLQESTSESEIFLTIRHRDAEKG